MILIETRKTLNWFNEKNYLILFQRNCIEFALNAKPVRRYIPKNPIQYKLWAFVTSPVFEYTIFVMILINTLSLAMKFYKQPLLYTQFLDVLNVIFTVFFTMEFVFKLGAFRFKVWMDFRSFQSWPFFYNIWFVSSSFKMWFWIFKEKNDLQDGLSTCFLFFCV